MAPVTARQQVWQDGLMKRLTENRAGADMDAVVEWVDARERLPRSGYPVAAAVSGPPRRRIRHPLGSIASFYFKLPERLTSTSIFRSML